MCISRTHFQSLLVVAVASFFPYVVTNTSHATSQIDCNLNAPFEIIQQPQDKQAIGTKLPKGTVFVSNTNLVVIDLGLDGFHFARVNAGVNINIKEQGNRKFVQWIAKDGNDAFLVQDLNGNGIVDGGTELFGLGPQHETGASLAASGGFHDLAQYDDVLLGGNGDGLISASDLVWRRLAYWIDSNADGNSTGDEMFGTMDIGITHFNILAFHNSCNISGYHAPWWIWAYKQDGEKFTEYKVINVRFMRLFNREPKP